MASASPGENTTVEAIRSLFSSRNTDETVLGALAASYKGLEHLMRSAELTDEVCGILIHLIARVSNCEMPSRRQKVLEVLNFFSDSPILDKRGADLLLRKHEDEQHSLSCILTDYISVLEKINVVMPASMVSAQKIGLITLLQKQIEDVEDLQSDEVINDRVNHLHNNLLMKLAEKAQSKRADIARRELPEDKWKPPDDFHQLSVIPVEHDLIYETLFLRKNKSIGRYINLDHYLDVQFRLYKEDCIVPLREAYEEFIMKDKDKKHFRMDTGRIYRDIQILKGASTSPEHGEVFIVELSHDHRKRIKWTNSRRLTFGALLIMSFDRFKSTFFAVIADADPERLRDEGLFKVKIYRTRQNQQIPRETPGIILEATSAYFEAYYHVLLALQSIDDFLPFEKYIVDCNNQIDLPKYLAMDPERRYDLTPTLSGLLINKTSYRLRGPCFVEVADTDSWPTKELLGMDESQRQAFISALTKEFVLIQGPPGTGKTYLGLQIAKTLLHNRDVWKHKDHEMNLPRVKAKKPCLLVVCYTNHALDQFIEGIINFLPNSETEIYRRSIPEVIRIGSRCKNQVVEKYSIKNFRYIMKEGGEHLQVMKDAEEARKNVLSIRAALKAIHGQRIVVSIANMKQVMNENHAQFFCLDPNAMNKWLDWLNASMKKWSEGSQKKRSNKNKSKKPKPKEFDEMMDIVADTEFEINERSLDDDDNFEFNESILGVNLDKQLNAMLEVIPDVTYQERLKEEEELTLEELKEGPTADERMINSVKNVWTLNLKDRWKMYRYWLRLFVDSLKDELHKAEEKFNKIFENYRRAKAEIDEAILKETSVIAITTTGAAKYHDSLMKIGPRITIVEEAAEVPEAHIVTAINPDCEHLILIGDHKQLEPKPAVQKLAIKYNLSVSLFERMLNNGLHYNCLQRQHRMRPEISDLVRHMYPVLEDNFNVLDYEDVRGISHNLYFISHEHAEKFNEDGKSFSNEHEAEFIKHLCEYLLKQGYQRSEITIIAAYTGQMFLIRSKMPRNQFEGVNICVLDNYQGEENEIIILSLVRSNEFGDIGFLRRENRICVALSRAKKGLYILGNSDTLGKKSEEWRTIISKIKATSVGGYKVCLLGKYLPLYCQNHPETKNVVESYEDFKKVPEGGCDRKCEMRLDCGHACRLYCHPYDRNHDEYECRNACHLRCPDDHVCMKKCHYPIYCECSVVMNRTLDCGHSVLLECHLDPNEHTCRIKVHRELECGHIVSLECHIDHDRHRCTETVNGTRPCGHEFERRCFDINYERRTKCAVDVEKIFPECQHKKVLPCHTDINYAICTKPVPKTIDCGHLRILSCEQWKFDISTCKEKCGKTCQNDHICQRTCHYPNTCDCKIKMNKTLPDCGHNMIMECCEDETSYKDCNVEVEMTFDLCGHTVQLPCNKKTEIEDARITKYMRHSLETKLQCSQDVEVKLQCGHNVNVQCWRKTKFKSLSLIQLSYTSAESILCTKCNTNVYFELKCGHLGSAECWKKVAYDKQLSVKCLEGDAEIRCGKIVRLEIKCGHTVAVECWKQHKYMNKKLKRLSLFFSSSYMDSFTHNLLVDELGIKCKSPVDQKLDCGHVMEMSCWESCHYQAGKSSALKLKCTADVFVEMPSCRHSMKIKCHERDTFIASDGKCTQNVLHRYEKCGHSIQIKCFENEQYKSLISRTRTSVRQNIPLCKEIVEKRLTCGHTAKVICSNTNNIECTQECKSKLLCGHICKRSCKICQEQSAHKECHNFCEQQSFCGHQCTSKSCMNCTPCKRKCEFWCSHSVCSHKCIEPCLKCPEPCSWKCKHHKCTKSCFEICDRLRCDMNCDEILTCGHKCSGFCGEPCPKLCFECDRKNFHLDTLDESSDFTVTLVECGHSFKYQYLDKYITEGKNNLITKCPLCNGPIYYHPRYNKIIKTKKRYAEKVKCILSNTRNLVNNTFPICEAGDIQKLHNYVGKFVTFLQLTKYTETDKEQIDKINLLQSQGKCILKKIEHTKKTHLQSWVDIADEILEIRFAWVAQIISRNEELLDKQFMVRLRNCRPFLSNDDYECDNDEIDYWSNSNATETIDRLSILQLVKGRELSSELLHCQSIEQRNRVRSILRQIQHHFTDIPQAMEAIMYPKLICVIGTHARDWKICPKDHLTPTVLRKDCVTCSKHNLDDGWLQFFNPVLPQFEQREEEEQKNKKGKKNRKKRSNNDNTPANDRSLDDQQSVQQVGSAKSQIIQGRGRGRDQRSSSQRRNHYTRGHDSQSSDRDSNANAGQIHDGMNLESENFLESLLRPPQQDIPRGYRGDQRRGGFRGRRQPRRGGLQRNTANDDFQFPGNNQQNTQRNRSPANFHFRTELKRGADAGFGRDGQRGLGRGSNASSWRDGQRGFGRGAEAASWRDGHDNFGQGTTDEFGRGGHRGFGRGTGAGGRNGKRGFRRGRRGRR